MVKTLLSYILDNQGQLTIVDGQVWPKIKLNKAFKVVLDTCKNDEDPSRNESIRVLTLLLPLSWLAGQYIAIHENWQKRNLFNI